MHKFFILLYTVVIFILFGCSGEDKAMSTAAYQSKIETLSSSSLKNLSKKIIFFGHRSVGRNIINGIVDLKKINPDIKLNVVKFIDLNKIDPGTFLHKQIGKNTEPESKLADFSDIINSELGKNINIAFMKFCYLDIVPETNIHKIFNNYRNKMEKLKETHPNIQFIHFTVPLTARQTGLKAYIKKLLGKYLRGEEDNMRRDEYNNLLRNYYQNKDIIFDLAKIESTFPDGKICTFKKKGKSYPCLVPSYTDDGEHLNKTGRRYVAEELLHLLTKL